MYNTPEELYVRICTYITLHCVCISEQYPVNESWLPQGVYIYVYISNLRDINLLDVHLGDSL